MMQSVVAQMTPALGRFRSEPVPRRARVCYSAKPLGCRTLPTLCSFRTIAGIVMKRLWSDQRGAALMEYTLLVGLVTLAVLTLIISIGGWTSGIWTNFLAASGTP